MAKLKDIPVEEVEEKENVLVEKPEDIIPERDSKEWNNYIFSLFANDELFNGNPTVDGLRRVVRTIGRIKASAPTQLWEPCSNNGYRAIVMWQLELDIDGNSEIWGSTADAFVGNVDVNFVGYLTAVAETRAEARTYRKALGIKCVAHEEIVNTNSEDGDEPQYIQPFQINTMNTMCSRYNIDVMKLINKSKNGPFKKIELVPYNVAQNIIAALMQYQRDNSKIPQDVKGYQADWRKNEVKN